jgi:hypothetical protein
MLNYMEELTSSWVGYVRHRNAVQDKVISLVRKTDTRFGDDEELRQSELKRLQRSFYRVAIADKLLDQEQFKSSSPARLLEMADEILEKRGNVRGNRGGSDMRTAEEERYCGTVRVRWSTLLKRARVRAADPRGGDTSHYRIG